MRNETLDNFAIKFIEEHFDEIDLKRTEWNVKTKQEAIDDINNDSTTSSWVIIEVMSWGTKTDYLSLSDIVVVCDERPLTIKVDNKYFQYSFKEFSFVEVFPKVVMVEKMIFE